MESKDPFFAVVPGDHDSSAMDLEPLVSKLKRKRDQIDESFDFDGILPDMQGEIIVRMSPLIRQMFSFTSKKHYQQRKKELQSTHSWFLLAAQEGYHDLFLEIEEDFFCPYNGDPVDLLKSAIENDQVNFVRGFLETKPYAKKAMFFIGTKLNMLIDTVGRYASWPMAKVILDIVAPSNGISGIEVVGDGPVHVGDTYNTLKRLIYSASQYSNIELLKSMKKFCGKGIAGYTEHDRRTLLLTSLGSCRRETVVCVAELFDLPLSMADKRFIIIHEDAPLISISFLHFMRELKCSPSASAVVCNALFHKDEDLLKFSLEEVGCKLRDIERALVSFASASHRAIFNKVFDNPHYLVDVRPLPRLKGGVTREGITFFKEKRLLHPLHLRSASSKTPPELLFFLVDLEFPIQFFALLHCVVRHDDQHHLVLLMNYREMIRGLPLVEIVIKHDSVKVIPTLIDRGYITIDDLLKQTVITMAALVAPPNTRTITNGAGLRQLYVGLRHALRLVAYPSVDADGKSMAPPPFRASDVLSSLSSVKWSDSPHQEHLISKIYTLMLNHEKLWSDIMQTYLKQAIEKEQPASLIELLTNA